MEQFKGELTTQNSINGTQNMYQPNKCITKLRRNLGLRREKGVREIGKGGFRERATTEMGK